jgi:hypothetical protein
MSRTISTIVDNADTRGAKIQDKEKKRKKEEEGKRENSKRWTLTSPVHRHNEQELPSLSAEITQSGDIHANDLAVAIEERSAGTAGGL